MNPFDTVTECGTNMRAGLVLCRIKGTTSHRGEYNVGPLLWCQVQGPCHQVPARCILFHRGGQTFNSGPEVCIKAERKTGLDTQK